MAHAMQRSPLLAVDKVKAWCEDINSNNQYWCKVCVDKQLLKFQQTNPRVEAPPQAQPPPMPNEAPTARQCCYLQHEICADNTTTGTVQCATFGCTKWMHMECFQQKAATDFRLKTMSGWNQFARLCPECCARWLKESAPWYASCNECPDQNLITNAKRQQMQCDMWMTPIKQWPRWRL